MIFPWRHPPQFLPIFGLAASTATHAHQHHKHLSTGPRGRRQSPRAVPTPNHLLFRNGPETKTEHTHAPVQGTIPARALEPNPKAHIRIEIVAIRIPADQVARPK